VIVAEFIAAQRTDFRRPYAIACRALEVSQSWFHKWINHKPAFACSGGSSWMSRSI
jgi:putative transposase